MAQIGTSLTNTELFVNPYTFIGLPSSVNRREPLDHGSLVDAGGVPTLVGSIAVRWRLETPLLLPATAQSEGWIQSDGRVRLPGSSMKGAIRNLHESLFNGCLRVVASDFLPAYRVAPTAEVSDWTLAVITVSRDGIPLEVALCSDQVWVESTTLKSHYPTALRLPRSGDVLLVSGDRTDSPLGRTEICAVSAVRDVRRPEQPTSRGGRFLASAKTDDWVLLVSDTGVRTKNHANSLSWASCFWATGKIGPTRLAVSEVVVKSFRQACEGSRDRQVLRRPASDQQWRASTVYDSVKWWPAAIGDCLDAKCVSPDYRIRKKAVTEEFKLRARPVGLRAKASGLLHAGDVVWVLTKASAEACDDEVTEISLAQIWRRLGGDQDAASRLPNPDGKKYPPVLPCRHPYPPADTALFDDQFEIGLCPSCRVFGSADTSGERGGVGAQEGYAAKVRIGPAISITAPQYILTRLAPMSSPHPGAGMFYLEHEEPSKDRAAGDLPSQWGSNADKKRVRQLRGRKFYWHGDPDGQAQFWKDQLGTPVGPRYGRRSHQREDLSRQAQLVPAGTVFEQTIHVDGLDREAVIMLLATIEPERLLHLTSVGRGRTFAIRLGGGKPFGLGSATSEITSLELTETGRRYALGNAVAEDQLAMTNSLRIKLLKSDQLSKALSQICRVLDLDGLEGWKNHLSYPPGAPWSKVDTKQFDNSYAFFGQYDGKKTGAPLKYEPLPKLAGTDVVGFDPTLPVARSRR